MFGLGGDGNHGEDVKEYWWYVDSTPTHSWMRWRYHYPQAAFPYRQLIDGNAGADRTEPEYELLDTGVFAEDRYWAVTVDYAKASPTDMCMVVTVANRGPEAATIHVLPTLWFRNTWGWGLPGHDAVPTITATGGRRLVARARDARPTGARRRRRRRTRAGLRQRDQRASGCGTCRAGRRTRRTASTTTSYTARTRVNPAMTGTKAALHYVLDRAGRWPARRSGCGSAADRRRRRRSTSATTFADGHGRRGRPRPTSSSPTLVPAGTTADEAAVVRAAIAGLMWGKQYYHFDVDRWLTGDPATTAAAGRAGYGRNSHWWHMHAAT